MRGMQVPGNQPINQSCRFGDITIDLSNFRLFKDDEQRRITPRAFEVLVYLARNSTRVVGKQELFDEVWGDSFVTDNALTRIIREIRQALGDDADSPMYIETVPKRGYRLLLPVEIVERAVANSDAAAVSYETISVEEEVIEIDDDVFDVETNGSPRALLKGSKTRRKTLLLLLAGGLLLSVVSGFGYFFYKTTSVKPILTSENIGLQRLTNTDNIYWAMFSPNGQFVAYVLLHPDGRQSLHLLDIGSRSERMVVPPENVSFYGGGFKPDSSELYYDTMPHGVPDPKTVLYQVPVLGDTPRKILEAVSGPISFTPDGKRFVFSRLNPATGAGQLVSANSADGSGETIVAEGKYDEDFRAPSFSPDGTTILFVAGERRDDGWYWHVGEIPAEGGERKLLCEPRKQRLWGASWLGRTGDILVNAQAPDTKNSQLFIMPRGTGELTRLTNDLNNYSGLSATADGTKIVVTQDQRMNDIWIWSGAEAEKPRKITNQSVIIHSCTWTPSGRVIYNILENGKDLLWSIGSDGTGRSQLTSPEVEGDFADVSPDGRFILYLSNRSGSWQLWRMNADGSGAKQLTPDSESPVRGRFALGGSKIIFERRNQDVTVLAFMDVDGGPPQDFSEQHIGTWSTTNDGRMVVYTFYDKPSGKYKTAVRSLEDLTQVRHLDVLPKDFVLLSPDGRNVLTKRNEPEYDPMSTVWAYPVDGGEPKRVLQNAPDNIYWAEYSDDNKSLAMVQGRVISNLVLFTRTQK